MILLLRTLSRRWRARAPGRRLGVQVACALLLVAPMANASPIASLQATLETQATDNVLRAPRDERSDTIFLPGVAIGLLDQWERFDLDANYRYRARRFRRDSFPNDQILTGSAELGFEVVPGRYRVALGHDRQQNLQDPQFGDTPENQVETDALSLTQEVTLLATPLYAVDAIGAFTRMTGANPADESDRVTLELMVDRRIDDRTTLGVAAEYLDVDYELDALPDFDRRSVLGRARRNGRTWTLDLGVGHNEIRREGFDASGGLAVDLTMEWRPTVRTRVRVSGDRRLTDQSAQGAFALADPDGFLTPAEFDGLVFEETTANVEVAFARERFETFVSLGTARQDFEESDESQRTRSASIGLSYRLQPRLSLSGVLRRSDIDFEGGFDDDGSRDDELRSFEVGLDWEVGPRTVIGLTLRDERRDSSEDDPGPGDGAAGFFVYDERVVVLRLARSLL